jgi:amino acid adenylation domain-containing protein
MSVAIRSAHNEAQARSSPTDQARSLPETFEQQVNLHRKRTALSADGWTPTYEMLNAVANRIARYLLSRGGSRGDRIALLMRHDTPLMAAVLAVLKAARIVVVLNSTDPPTRHRQVLGDADPGLILTDSANRQVAHEVAGATCDVFCLDGLFTGLSAPNPGLLIAPDDIAFLIYTSGSTGRPKGVMQTHRKIMHNAHRVARGMELTAEDRVVLPASLSGGHGVAVTWCSLLNGATLCPFPLSERGMSGLADFLRAQEITIYSSSASVFRHFVKTLSTGDHFPQVRIVRLGSEPASSDDFTAFQRHFDDGCILLHTLSSSETGNIAQIRLARDDCVAQGRLPVGQPVEGVDVLLVDEQGMQVADGEAGEIVVKSRFLSSGYWRNTSLTAERFGGPDKPGGIRTFRTGDVARRTPEGLLAVVGRRDARFKMHGFVVEPVEIENALLHQPGVEQTLVCRPPNLADAPLVAFLTLRVGHTASATALRRALRDTLPSHMVPTSFVFLDSFPLTPHGKVDREKLCQMIAPGRPRQIGEPPTTDSERLLAAIWAEIFDQEFQSIGKRNDFFEMGGDSLKAAVVTAKIHAALGVEIDLGTLTTNPTLSALAAVIDTLRRAGAHDRVPRPVPTSREAGLPLSYEQERTWMYSRTPEASAAYTVACSHSIDGPLDVDALRVSMSYIAGRHEILRTSFDEIDNKPVQIVHSPSPVSVPLLDFTHGPDAEEQATLFLRSEARRAFDLTQPPLLRFWIIKIRDDHHWLLRISHHIISDTWSWKVYLRELGLLYEARIRGKDFPLPEVAPLQYGDYAIWQRRALGPESPHRHKAITWWKSLFAGGPTSLDLPFQRAETFPRAEPGDGLRWWGLRPDISSSLENFRREESTTYYSVRLAAFVALLVGETGRSEVIVGTYATNRSRIEFQDIFGFFANLMTLRLCCDLGCTFREWVSIVRRTVNEAVSHGEIPHEQLCEELRKQGTIPPDVHAIFGASDHNSPIRFGGLEVTWLDRRMETMPWGFSLTFDQHNEHDHCRVDFDARIYDPHGVSAFIDRLIRFLDAASFEPDLKLSQLLEMTGPPQHSRVSVGL